MLMKKVLSKLMMLLIWMRLTWQLLEEKRSEYVRGTGTNIIEGDKLFLATPLLTNRNILNRGYVGDKKCKL